jgi:propanol-preferring alcohol dehydrogenase
VAQTKTRLKPVLQTKRQTISKEISMRAAVLREYGQPLVIDEVPTPETGPGEVLVKVEACGICHSDLHLAGGDWELLKPITRLPLILGHEVAGTVASLGEGVEGLEVGDRVGVPWIHWTCGECEYCQIGRETLCLKQLITGCMVDGGFAEFIKAKASHTAKLPSALSFEEAAPLLCAGLTVYKALKSSGVRVGERLAVFGVGGLGHLAVQLAHASGVKVCAVDIADDKLQLARECGADLTVNAAATAAHREIKAWGGAHVAIVTSASRTAYETALRSLKRGGTLVVVGMAPEPLSISAVSLVSGELRIIASAVGTRQDLRELLELAAAGKVRCKTERCSLEQVEHVFEEMKQGRVIGRVVLQL